VLYIVVSHYERSYRTNVTSCYVHIMLYYIVSYHEVSRFILLHILAQYVMSHELRLVERLNSNNCAVTALEKARAGKGRACY
jgi:hypothetical protein